MSWNIGDNRNLFLKLKTKLGLYHVELKTKDSPETITLTLVETQQLQNVENLVDYGCSKIQDLVKTDNVWICSRYPFRHKTRLHCAERKAKVYGEWAMQHL